MKEVIIACFDSIEGFSPIETHEYTSTKSEFIIKYLQEQYNISIEKLSKNKSIDLEDNRTLLYTKLEDSRIVEIGCDYEGFGDETWRSISIQFTFHTDEVKTLSQEDINHIIENDKLFLKLFNIGGTDITNVSLLDNDNEQVRDSAQSLLVKMSKNNLLSNKIVEFLGRALQRL